MPSTSELSGTLAPGVETTVTVYNDPMAVEVYAYPTVLYANFSDVGMAVGTGDSGFAQMTYGSGYRGNVLRSSRGISRVKLLADIEMVYLIRIVSPNRVDPRGNATPSHTVTSNLTGNLVADTPLTILLSGSPQAVEILVQAIDGDGDDVLDQLFSYSINTTAAPSAISKTDSWALAHGSPLALTAGHRVESALGLDRLTLLQPGYAARYSIFVAEPGAKQ